MKHVAVLPKNRVQAIEAQKVRWLSYRLKEPLQEADCLGLGANSFRSWKLQESVLMALPELYARASHSLGSGACTEGRQLPAQTFGNSLRGHLLLRILEWVAISFSRGSSRSRDCTHVFCHSFIGRRMLYTEPPGKPQLKPILARLTLHLEVTVLPYTLHGKVILKFNT